MKQYIQDKTKQTADKLAADIFRDEFTAGISQSAAAHAIETELRKRDEVANKVAAALENMAKVVAIYGTGSTQHIDHATGEAITPIMKAAREALADFRKD